MDDFEIGDMVRFKTGGPMIIIDSNNKADFHHPHCHLCSWFTTTGEYREEWIDIRNLEKVDKIEAAIKIKDVNKKFEFLMLGEK
jgi:uncharacterized protein YodC (DUF2158 family)